MGAFGLEERFKYVHESYRLTEPSAYTITKPPDTKPNKYPFRSSNPRKTSTGPISWTSAVYDCDIKPRIPNVTSLNSKVPRFPYEAFKIEDFDEILCRCGIENPCECPIEGEQEEVICQANVRKRLYKGAPPHSGLGGGISMPSKQDRGFEILPDGSARRILDITEDHCPPFYDARVHESTEFYKGWKWSKWTSQRKNKSLEERPGPADYTLERGKTRAEMCAEKVRAEACGKSKQLRYIEALQNENIRQGRPGPADYSPQLPKGTDLQFLGSKGDRFPPAKYDIRPSPADYSIRRAFDLPEIPKQPCHARLPTPACFGIKAPRFKYRVEKSPGPADYDANVKLCHILNCGKAPFGCSAKRFKQGKIDDDAESIEHATSDDNEEKKVICPNIMWQFKSRTKRFLTNQSKFDPEIPYVKPVTVKRSARLQYLSPFLSSQGRFQPWRNYVSINSGLDTPGPGYYNANKAKCLPAVHCGPLCRAPRFKSEIFDYPAPNEYIVGRGIETILATHNQRLKNNLRNQYVFRLAEPVETKCLTLEERELLLLTKAIAQLDVTETKVINVRKKSEDKKKLQTKISKIYNEVIKSTDDIQADSENVVSAYVSVEVKKRTGADKKKELVADKHLEGVSGNIEDDEVKSPKHPPEKPKLDTPKPKLLRTFLYKHPMPTYF